MEDCGLEEEFSYKKLSFEKKCLGDILDSFGDGDDCSGFYAEVINLVSCIVRCAKKLEGGEEEKERMTGWVVANSIALMTHHFMSNMELYNELMRCMSYSCEEVKCTEREYQGKFQIFTDNSRDNV